MTRVSRSRCAGIPADKDGRRVWLPPAQSRPLFSEDSMGEIPLWQPSSSQPGVQKSWR